jgi:hypothetical protein
MYSRYILSYFLKFFIYSRYKFISGTIISLQATLYIGNVFICILLNFHNIEKGF